MARHKRKKASHHRRRRRVGAAPSGMMAVAMKAGGIAAGAYVGGMVAKMVPATIDAKITGGALLVGGVVVAAKFSKGNPLIEGIGYGIAAKGANTALTSLGLISGIGSLTMPGVGVRRAVGAPMRTPIGSNGTTSGNFSPVGAVKAMSVIGALYDN